MASFHVSVPHAIGRDAALARVERFLDEVRQSYAAHISEVQGQWSENRLDFSSYLCAADSAIVSGKISHVNYLRRLGDLVKIEKADSTLHL